MIKIFFILTLLTISLFSTVNRASVNSNAYMNYDESNSDYAELKLKDAEFEKYLKNLKNPKRLQLECDTKNNADSCYIYAGYMNLVLGEYKQSYDYFIKAFDLGLEQSGVYIAGFQLNQPELFNDSNRLTIGESIRYAEQAFKTDFPDATRLLTVIYREPKFNRVDLKKSEYYNKIAIEQNVKMSRFLLASLYTYEMKDKSKINESINLYQDDLMIEKNWQSALALMTIHLYPEEYGATFEPDLVKTLAYAYVSSDLRDGRNENGFNNVDTRFAAAMQTELPPETLKQAKALYLEMMAQMNDAHQ